MDNKQEKFITIDLFNRLESASILKLALKYVILWRAPRRMEIHFDGEVCIEGLSTGFTNAAIEVGIIHCRSLLYFLGISLDPKNNSKLKIRPSKRKDDFVIEDFVGPNGPLSKITIKEALSPYLGESDEAETALARLIHIANKSVAHLTHGNISDPENLRLLEIASCIIPTLVGNHFYNSMGMEVPSFELSSRPGHAP